MLRLCSLACLFGWGLLFVLGGTARAAEETGLKLQVDPSYVCITRDDRPLLKYRYGDGPPKPYVLELYSPAGVQILRDSPVDHVHHRGLMYGIFVNGIDFWSEQPNHGKQGSLERKGSVRELAGGAAARTAIAVMPHGRTGLAARNAAIETGRLYQKSVPWLRASQWLGEESGATLVRRMHAPCAHFRRTEFIPF
jgi:hypothetical protein